MKEPQDADPDTETALGLEDRGRSLRDFGRKSKQFLLAPDGTFSRQRVRLATACARRNEAREPALQRLDAISALEFRELACHDGPCLHERLEALVDVRQRQSRLVCDLVIESLPVLAQAVEDDVHSPSIATPPA